MSNVLINGKEFCIIIHLYGNVSLELSPDRHHAILAVPQKPEILKRFSAASKLPEANSLKSESLFH
jgi:hypothetical protein